MMVSFSGITLRLQYKLTFIVSINNLLSCEEILETHAMVAGWPTPMVKPEIAMIRAISQKLAVSPRATMEAMVTIDPQLSSRLSPSLVEI